MAMHRLFVGLRPSPAQRLLLLGIAGGVPGARWQSDDQLHLTLRFIGEVDRPLAEDLAAALDRVSCPRPTVTLSGVGTFGRNGRMHTIWAGVAPDAALRSLQQRVERAICGCGLPPERRAFHPHVTLARLPRSAGPVQPFLAEHAALTSEPCTPDAFFLFESSLGGGGSIYSSVARYPLT